MPDVPKHKGNVGFNAGLTRYLNANVNVFGSSERPRMAMDTRSPKPAYALVDVALIAKEFIKGLEITGTVKNLFDKKYQDPSEPGTVPGDYPREGISFYAEAQYKY